MDQDERQRADDIDAYWDALLAGRASAKAAGSVQDLTETIARLRGAASFRTLFPSPATSWSEVRRAARPLGVTGLHAAVAPGLDSFSVNGRNLDEDGLPPVPHSHRTTGGWLANQLATAALLVVTLAVGLIVLLQESRSLNIDAIPTPAMVRALGTAPSRIVDTPLVEARFAPGELPAGDVEAIFYRLTLDPGMRLPSLAGPSCGCPGGSPVKAVGVEAVESGAYTLRLDAPVRVQRAGVTTRSEVVPAGTALTLQAGDAAIYPDYVAPGEIQNLGAEPVVLTGVVILERGDAGTPTEPLPVGAFGELISHSAPFDWREMPAGPIALSMRRLTLPAGTTIGPYSPIGLESLHVETGRISRQYFKREMGEPAGPAMFTYEKSAVPFNGSASKIRVAFSSPADEAAELLVAIIEPAGLWPGTLSS